MTIEQKAREIADGLSEMEREWLTGWQGPNVWPSDQLDAMVRAFDENYGKHGLRETLMKVVVAAVAFRQGERA